MHWYALVCCISGVSFEWCFVLISKFLVVTLMQSLFIHLQLLDSFNLYFIQQYAYSPATFIHLLPHHFHNSHHISNHIIHRASLIIHTHTSFKHKPKLHSTLYTTIHHTARMWQFSAFRRAGGELHLRKCKRL